MHQFSVRSQRDRKNPMSPHVLRAAKIWRIEIVLTENSEAIGVPAFH